MEFDLLYDRFARRLHGWALRRTAVRADAEDLIQDTFLAIHGSLSSFRGESDLDAWVFGVARNVWRVQARARARLKRAATRVSLDDVPDRELVDERTPVYWLELSRALSQVEAEGRAQLGADDWTLLVDYSTRDTDLDALIGESGLSRQALKSRISRARRRLYDACPELPSSPS